jgi:hypothetical protein
MNGATTLETSRRLLALGVLFAAWAGGAEARDKPHPSVIVSPESTMPAPETKLVHRGRSFVPLHSTLIGQGGVTRLNFSGTLSIHNLSATDPLAVEKVEYRNGSGQVIETFVAEPVYLRPYGSMQIIIAQDDVRAGVGASFTVDWAMVPSPDEPMIEAVMASFVGTRSYSFLSPARRVSRPD